MTPVNLGSRWNWLALRIVAGGALAIASAAPAAEGGGTLIACKEPGWAQWRGPRRDGVSDEAGLLQSWPEGGPKLLWTASEIGRGWSSPIIVGGTIFLTGDVGRQLRVYAMSMGGKPKWQVANGEAWKKPFPGARAACCYSAGRLYNMNGHGRVVCLEAATGKEIWAVEVYKRFAAKNPYFGGAECLLVDGPRLIVSPGGAKGLLAALDKETGKTVWASDVGAEGDETAGYSSPILVEFGGRRQIIATSSSRTFAADAATGKVLWTDDLTWDKQSHSTIPVFRGDSVFVTNAMRTDTTFYRLRIAPDNSAAKKVWSIKVSNGHGSILCVGGRLYGASAMGIKGWASIDADSGKVHYVKADLPVGSVTCADRRLYCLSEKGTMALLKPGPDAFETTGQFELVK